MYKIQPAAMHDVPGILTVARATWQATYGGILPPAVIEQALSAWYSEAGIARRVAANRFPILVAAADSGQVVGYVQIGHRPEPGDGEMYALYVLPEHHGQGVGYRLVQEGLAALTARAPVQRLFVQVERENAVGRSFYDRVGFQPVREYDHDLFGHSSPMLEMCLTLA